MNFVAIDFETTGLLPRQDRVIEIGLVRFSESFDVEAEFSTLINPSRDVGRTDIHGITPTMLAGAPTFADVAPKICEFINGSVLVAHNKRFDLDFLSAELRRAGIEPPALDAICTIELIRSAYPSSPRRLQDACRYLGFEPENAHEALADARMAALIAITVLRDSGFPALPEPVFIPHNSTMAPPAIKTRQAHEKTRPSSYLAELIGRLPETTLEAGNETVTANEYLNLLDRVIEDRVIDDDEAAMLTIVAGSLGLSAMVVRMLHSSYLYALCRSARADGQITESERRDIRLVAEALGIVGWEDLLDKDFEKQEEIGESPRSMPIGTRVCFTGQMDLTRSECEEEATRKGLIVCPRVTKDVQVLIVSDPRTQSTKAQKARKYGARIMSERAFFREIDNYPDVEVEDGSNEGFDPDDIVIEVGGRIFPVFSFAVDEVATREHELTGGFAQMVKRVSPALLEPETVRAHLTRMNETAHHISDGEIPLSEACETVRNIVLDLWSHVRAVKKKWQEPSPSMVSSVEVCRDLTVTFLARSQAIVEVRTDEIAARVEIGELVRQTVELAATYEPRVHNSHLYLRERTLRETGAIPNTMLEGMSIVVTGDFIEFERDQAYRAITERGGKSPGSVSGRTYVLVAGEHAGWAKLEKALTAGIPVVGYADFLTILDEGVLPGVPKQERMTKTRERTPGPEVIETFSCRSCGKEFSRKRTAGRKPHECPDCRGIGAEG